MPEGARITANLRFTDVAMSWDAQTHHVTIKHYDPVHESMQDYFVMHRENLGNYYNEVNWAKNEVDIYGKKLVACVLQEGGLGGGRTSYTLEVFADVKS